MEAYLRLLEDHIVARSTPFFAKFLRLSDGIVINWVRAKEGIQGVGLKIKKGESLGRLAVIEGSGTIRKPRFADMSLLAEAPSGLHKTCQVADVRYHS